MKRALVLCDPSYEIKTDYARVTAMVADALKRFATGTYAVWYPIIPRPEAHDVPRKLKTLATKAGKSWLNATLTVKSSKLTSGTDGEVIRPGLPASGMLIKTLHFKDIQDFGGGIRRPAAVETDSNLKKKYK